MELMTKGIVLFDVEASTKEDIISKMAQAMDAEGRLNDRENYIADVLKREDEFSTAVGFLVATPHAKSTSVKCASLGFMHLAKRIQWDEDEEVELVFQIAVPEAEAGNRHLEILANVSRHLLHEEFREQLMKAASAEEVIRLMEE